jgi:hypothetical protein
MYVTRFHRVALICCIVAILRGYDYQLSGNLHKDAVWQLVVCMRNEHVVNHRNTSKPCFISLIIQYD